MLTAVGAAVKVITQGAANVPEPVTADVVIPALVRAVRKIGCSDVPGQRCSRLRVNREREGAANGISNIHIVDGARSSNIFNEPRFVHGDRSGGPCKGDHPGGG